MDIDATLSSYLHPPFLNLMSLVIERAGRVHVRVGGNSQEDARMVPELEDGKAIRKERVDTNNPVGDCLDTLWISELTLHRHKRPLFCTQRRFSTSLATSRHFYLSSGTSVSRSTKVPLLHSTSAYGVSASLETTSWDCRSETNPTFTLGMHGVLVTRALSLTI